MAIAGILLGIIVPVVAVMLLIAAIGLTRFMFLRAVAQTQLSKVLAGEETRG